MVPFAWKSAYKKGHSSETALTRINNDLLRAIDDNACVILVLLDLSAAFDTVDHQILLTRLKCRYGVKGNALAWPGHISQIGSSTSGWRMIVLLNTSWPVMSHRDLCWDQFCTLCTLPRLQMSSSVMVWGFISMPMTRSYTCHSSL